jgi:hypothetical protein
MKEKTTGSGIRGGAGDRSYVWETRRHYTRPSDKLSSLDIVEG